MSLSSSMGLDTKILRGCGVEGRERGSSGESGGSLLQLDRAWSDEGFGEADLRMLESDLWWPKLGRLVKAAWWDDQLATATKL